MCVCVSTLGWMASGSTFLHHPSNNVSSVQVEGLRLDRTQETPVWREIEQVRIPDAQNTGEREREREREKERTLALSFVLSLSLALALLLCVSLCLSLHLSHPLSLSFALSRIPLSMESNLAVRAYSGANGWCAESKPICSDSEAGSYLMPIDFCITQAQA